MPLLAGDVLHPNVTGNHGYQYLFTRKHHGAVSNAAQWLPSLSLEVEFAVFNLGDEHELSAHNGWLYGVRSDGDNWLEDLGTWDQQIAEFPQPDHGTPWHGYPVWAVNDEAPSNRRRQQAMPPKAVFEKMEEAGIISAQQRKRLSGGKHA